MDHQMSDMLDTWTFEAKYRIKHSTLHALQCTLHTTQPTLHNTSANYICITISNDISLTLIVTSLLEQLEGLFNKGNN